MNISPKIRTPQSVDAGASASGPARSEFKVGANHLPTLNLKLETLNSRSAGFTLIELLTVIAIIGILAALIVSGAGYAHTAKVKSRVITERTALQSAIARYYKAKGYYPPDGGLDPACVQTPLFYELTGTTPVVTPGSTNFFSKFSSESIPAAQVTALFNLGGFMNVDNTDGAAQNFYDGIKNVQHLVVQSTLPVSSQYTYTVMGVPASGPLTLNSATNNQSLTYINPWHYNSSHPTNNTSTYDLWMDVQYGGKTNRISNWSADPQVVSY